MSPSTACTENPTRLLSSRRVDRSRKFHGFQAVVITAPPSDTGEQEGLPPSHTAHTDRRGLVRGPEGGHQARPAEDRPLFAAAIIEMLDCPRFPGRWG